jgi:putative transposase
MAAASEAPVVRETEELVVQMAEQNRDWGYRRIQGALSNLGHRLAPSTIADILERHGMLAIRCSRMSF